MLTDQSELEPGNVVFKMIVQTQGSGTGTDTGRLGRGALRNGHIMTSAETLQHLCLDEGKEEKVQLKATRIVLDALFFPYS
jgi:hypothetical protein